MHDQPEYYMNQLIEQINIIKFCKKWVRNMSVGTKMETYASQQLTVEIKFLENLLLLGGKKNGKSDKSSSGSRKFDITDHINSE